MISRMYLDRPIAFHRVFVALGAGITGAVMLSQAVYWSSRTDDKCGWFYKTQPEWEDETGLTRYEQEGARKKLKALGILEEVKRGVPCKTFYRVNFSVLDNCLIQFAENHQTSSQKTSKQAGGKSASKPVENQQSITEITTETTTEITTEIIATDAQQSRADESDCKKSAGKTKGKRSTQLPDDFTPSQQHIDLAAQLGVNLPAEWPQFCDYHRAKGSTFKDWHAALRTWIRNSAKFKKGQPASNRPAYFRPGSAPVNYHEGIDEDGRF